MSLIAQFHQNRKRLFHRRHENSAVWEKQREKHIINFLKFCESRYEITKISKIKQKHYDGYIEHLAREKELSDETVRKISLSLKDFFERAGLKIKVAPNKAKKRRIQKKMEKIAKTLEYWGIENPEVIFDIKKAL